MATTGRDASALDGPELDELEAARARARGRHGDLAADDFQAVDLAAFAHAERVARDERELVAIFEAEVDRRIEERSVLGTPGSVLPSAQASAEVPSWLTGEEEARPVSEERRETTRTPEGQAAAAAAARAPVKAPTRGLSTGMDYVLAAAELRLKHGLDPERIAAELEVEPDYCVRCLTWFVRRADAALEAPSHVNRNELRAFAAGLTSIEQDFAIQYHARECRFCAEHLAGLLDRAIGMLEPDGGAAAGRSGHHPASATRRASPHGQPSYTSANPWAAPARPAAGRVDVPFMTLKAQALRRYMPSADPVASALVDRDLTRIEREPSAATRSRGGPARAQARSARLGRLMSSLPQVGARRRGYATTVLALVAGLTAVETGAAMTGAASPVLSAVDELGKQSGLHASGHAGHGGAPSAGIAHHSAAAADGTFDDDQPPAPPQLAAALPELPGLAAAPTTRPEPLARSAGAGEAVSSAVGPSTSAGLVDGSAVVADRGSAREPDRAPAIPTAPVTAALPVSDAGGAPSAAGPGPLAAVMPAPDAGAPPAVGQRPAAATPPSQGAPEPAVGLGPPADAAPAVEPTPETHGRPLAVMPTQHTDAAPAVAPAQPIAAAPAPSAPPAAQPAPALVPAPQAAPAAPTGSQLEEHHAPATEHEAPEHSDAGGEAGSKDGSGMVARVAADGGSDGSGAHPASGANAAAGSGDGAAPNAASTQDDDHQSSHSGSDGEDAPDGGSQTAPDPAPAPAVADASHASGSATAAPPGSSDKPPDSEHGTAAPASPAAAATATAAPAPAAAAPAPAAPAPAPAAAAPASAAPAAAAPASAAPAPAAAAPAPAAPAPASAAPASAAPAPAAAPQPAAAAPTEPATESHPSDASD